MTQPASLEARVGELLRGKGLHLATAESCTGGLIANRITNIAGASDYFAGGLVAYAYEAKVASLGVSWDTLRAHGAVSPETVVEMARGARTALGAHIGLSVSGIAGPAGGLPNKPVGTTWIGLSTAEKDWAKHALFSGDRLQIKMAASEEALKMLLDYLEGRLA